jgi:ferrous iron transport protein A
MLRTILKINPHETDPEPQVEAREAIGVERDACCALTDLEVGASARICSHVGARAVPRRLGDLGFVPDTPLRVVRRAPLGDPIEVELRGYRICLRHTDVTGVCVNPDREPARR